MSEEERTQKFLEEFQELQNKYGIMLKPDIQTEQLGAVWQIRPILRAEFDPKWKPEEE